MTFWKVFSLAFAAVSGACLAASLFFLVYVFGMNWLMMQFVQSTFGG